MSYQARYAPNNPNDINEFTIDIDPNPRSPRQHAPPIPGDYSNNIQPPPQSTQPGKKKKKLLNLPSVDEKREMHIYELKTNFPTKTVIGFACLFACIGLAAIGLQITLMVNQAVNWYWANGIWGGFLALCNAGIKLNLGRVFISHTYFFFLFV